MTYTEIELIAASQEIGGIHESAAWYTAILADKIEASGKPVGEFTISELLALDRETRERVRRAGNLAGVALERVRDNLLNN